MAVRLNAYLNFDGTARQALEFYGEVLGGTPQISTFAEFGDPGNDGVMHGLLETPGGLVLMASDMPPGMSVEPGNNFGMSLSGEAATADELRGYWEKFAAAGTVTMPLEKQMWGDEFGMVTDQFGTVWMVNIGQE